MPKGIYSILLSAYFLVKIVEVGLSLTDLFEKMIDMCDGEREKKKE